MADKKIPETLPQDTQDKMAELFALMDEKAAAGELNETEELQEIPQDEEPITGSEAAAYEYSIMMKQYEAMLEDYMRREAEEQAQKEAEAKAAEEPQ